MSSISTANTTHVHAIAAPPRDGDRTASARDVEALGEPLRDSVSISETARRLYDAEKEGEGSAASPGRDDLDPADQKEVEELKKRDREVRAHEQAHQSALGGEGGGASYTYTVGPDGNRYATGGEVAVDVSEVPGDPQATIERARRIARAAVAPAQPSGADYRVRARATQLEMEARQKLAEKDDESAEEAEATAPAGTCPTCGGPADHTHDEPAAEASRDTQTRIFDVVS